MWVAEDHTPRRATPCGLPHTIRQGTSPCPTIFWRLPLPYDFVAIALALQFIRNAFYLDVSEVQQLVGIRIFFEDRSFCLAPARHRSRSGEAGGSRALRRVSDSPEFRCPHLSAFRTSETELRKSETGTRKRAGAKRSGKHVMVIFVPLTLGTLNFRHLTCTILSIS